jgi:hypothetical protein
MALKGFLAASKRNADFQNIETVIPNLFRAINLNMVSTA